MTEYNNTSIHSNNASVSNNETEGSERMRQIASFCALRFEAIAHDETSLPDDLAKQKEDLITNFASAALRVEEAVESGKYPSEIVEDMEAELFTNYMFEITDFDEQCVNTFGSVIGLDSADDNSNPYNFLSKEMLDMISSRREALNILSGQGVQGLSEAFTEAAGITEAVLEADGSSSVLFGKPTSFAMAVNDASLQSVIPANNEPMADPYDYSLPTCRCIPSDRGQSTNHDYSIGD